MLAMFLVHQCSFGTSSPPRHAAHCVPVVATTWVFAVAAACVPRGVAGWQTSGVLPARSHFAAYVGKFCFDFKRDPHEEAGKFEFNLDGRVVAGPHESSAPLANTDGPPCWGPCETQGNLYLMAFDDEEDHWQQAHRGWNNLTCEKMLEFSSYAVPLPTLNGPFNRSVFVPETVRPRFWYFTFAACGVTITQPVSYSIRTQNILQGWQREFGMDARGSLQLQLLAALLFLGVGLCLRGVQKRATGAEALRSRPLLRMLLLSVCCSAGGATCLALHYAAYAYDGLGSGPLEALGQLLVCVAKALLASLQVLTAKGWALFFYAPQEEPLARGQLAICALAGIICTSAACEIHADYLHTSSTTLCIYESWPGFAVLSLNVLLFLEAWRSMRETYRLETSDKVRVFRVVMSAASLAYFLALPLACILAVAFAPWVRAKYISRAEVASRLLASLLLAFCLRPSRLDAMVNARLEEGLRTVGEMRDDFEENSTSFRGAADDASEDLANIAALRPAE